MSESPQSEEGVLLSIVIPTHNVRPWIAETLYSVLGQDVDGLEVIVVDDHSDDGTVEVVERCIAGDPRARLVRAESFGGGSARNEGVRWARGRYLAFADGDDIVPDGAYRAMVASLERTGSQVVIGDYIKFSPASTWRPTASMTAFSQPAQGVSLTQIPTMIFSRPCWNKVFDRSFWLGNGIEFPDVVRSNDIVPMTTAYVKASAIDVIEDVVYLYRDRPGGSSMTAKAPSSAAFISYLTQEAICADLLSSVGEPELESRYAALIYDRDGFFHARKFLSAWSGERDDDGRVVALLEELLERCAPAPRWIDARKRMTMHLLRRGEFLAARAAAQTVDGGAWRAEDAGTRMDAWTALLKSVVAEPELFAEVERVLRTGALATLGGIRPGAGDFEAHWDRLAEAAVSVFGDEVRAEIPELGSGTPVAVRAETGGTVSAIFGGDPVRLHGSSSTDDVVPVLWSSEGCVHPVRVDWRRGQDSAVWDAEFRVSHLPRGRELQPALRFADGRTVAVHVDAPVPEYRRLENVLYEQEQGWVRLSRRRHWLVRAPRRALITVRDRLRALRR
ncbi:glycosyltransferase family 2 protein [Microbacterium soli]|uniref:Glycosyltransferase 2-like domain-containing protein n=1 Tax=Microbacterium soli TaxID=446075 RepID=A0ABP7MP96_9MICO